MPLGKQQSTGRSVYFECDDCPECQDPHDPEMHKSVCCTAHEIQDVELCWACNGHPCVCDKLDDQRKYRWLEE